MPPSKAPGLRRVLVPHARFCQRVPIVRSRINPNSERGKVRGDEQNGRKKAGKLLTNRKSKTVKSVAGSDLAQTKRKAKGKGKMK
jgi:hypothetical protein